MAVPFLREVAMPCTEQQMEALTSCLSRTEAFGPVNAWGPEVFFEIGTLAGTVEKNHILKAVKSERLLTDDWLQLKMSPEGGRSCAKLFSGVV